MTPHFIDEEIQVRIAGEVSVPVGFTWRNQEYMIQRLIHHWQDWGFGAGAIQRNWRSRRHRNYYRVQTDSGELWEFYLDRNTPDGKARWYLYQQLDPVKDDPPSGDTS